MFKSLVNYINALLNSWTDDRSDKKDVSGVLSEKNKRIKYSSQNNDDFPESITDNIIYVVGEGEYKWLVVLKCPCGCNDVIQLNLLKESKPSWEVYRHRDGVISISPSINRIVNCKSHFSVIRGEIWWWGEWPEYDDPGY